MYAGAQNIGAPERILLDKEPSVTLRLCWQSDRASDKAEYKIPIREQHDEYIHEASNRARRGSRAGPDHHFRRSGRANAGRRYQLPPRYERQRSVERLRALLAYRHRAGVADL